MQPLNFVQTVLNQQQLNGNLAFALRPGQIVSGQVTKLYPNQVAEVLIGSNKVIAQLETPLSIQERHWFQVQSGEGKVHLKVLEANEGTETVMRTENVLKALSLPNSKENALLLEFMQTKQLPITKETMHTAADWLKGKPLKEGLNVIEVTLNKELPFTKSILNSIRTIIEDEPISSIIDRLKTVLKNSDQHEAKRLISMIDPLIKLDSKTESDQTKNIQATNSKIILEELKNVIRKIGYSYENETFKLLKEQDGVEINKIESLKPHLIRLLSEEVSAPVREASEKLMNKITGYQVLSQEAGPIQHLVFQVPLAVWGNGTDLTMQWSGRKNDNGKIDPNFCRILFYLSLEHIKDTIVDLHVQNRVISISVLNHREDLKEIANLFIPNLKKALEELNYHLSSVNFEKPSDRKISKTDVNKKQSNYKLPNNYSGVDFRI
ncbi:hypothetical protein [Bacillus sp. S/N-304-OC-R1]|uniref:hypothetical protein n=1 Tax=Bacillus sp. S/N-304-OC-R1 TaxID=2758034 RepID=UPI001C8F1402|nr:hypothetical protein [Bacillus sp. S/N-304-OC-R1]MBY0120712.1 hypothetical protein [Bacillus sp. S/N-304-OC-R1]